MHARARAHTHVRSYGHEESCTTDDACAWCCNTKKCYRGKRAAMDAGCTKWARALTCERMEQIERNVANGKTWNPNNRVANRLNGLTGLNPAAQTDPSYNWYLAILVLGCVFVIVWVIVWACKRR